MQAYLEASLVVVLFIFVHLFVCVSMCVVENGWGCFSPMCQVGMTSNRGEGQFSKINMNRYAGMNPLFHN